MGQRGCSRVKGRIVGAEAEAEARSECSALRQETGLLR